MLSIAALPPLLNDRLSYVFTLPVVMVGDFNIVKFRTASVSFNLNITAVLSLPRVIGLSKSDVLYVKQVTACAVHKHFLYIVICTAVYSVIVKPNHIGLPVYVVNIA